MNTHMMITILTGDEYNKKENNNIYNSLYLIERIKSRHVTKQNQEAMIILMPDLLVVYNYSHNLPACNDRGLMQTANNAKRLDNF